MKAFAGIAAILLPSVAALAASVNAPEPDTTTNNTVQATVPELAAPPPDTLSAVNVLGKRSDLLGVAASGSEGSVNAEEIAQRPLARTGELLETVPGMIITQHTGGGKANQYYLRGFNLDHGTDFATFVDGVPVNLPTHAHGPGYTDLNWLIPELVQGVHYEKGPYYPKFGDFANAGAAEIDYVSELPRASVTAESGTLGYSRLLVAGSPAAAGGHLLYAAEAMHSDGAWDVKNNFRKTNALLKWTVGDASRGYSISAQGYQGIWLGSDQIPQRAIDAGILSRYGAVDKSTGGDTKRYSAYGQWHSQDDDGATKVELYAIKYALDLYSDFSYALDQVRGDQIEQADHRTITGVAAAHTYYGTVLGAGNDATFGLQLRQDDIYLDLNSTKVRALLAPVRQDFVAQQNLSIWFENMTRWTDWYRTAVGARLDSFNFRVKSQLLAANSGSKNATAISPKLGLTFGPWAKTEYYLQGGLGLRTNDARGVVEKLTPDGTAPATTLEPISRSRGAEIGVRCLALPHLQATLALWTLAADSEIYFSGDQGASVDSGRSSRRTGLESTNAYDLESWLTVDADYALSKARYTDHADLGDHVAEAITAMGALGITLQRLKQLPDLSTSLRLRYLGPRDLTEDASQKSAPSTVLNYQLAYVFAQKWQTKFEVLNLTNAQYNDNEYYYESRLPGESKGPEASGGYNDHMVHAGEPRSIRAGLTAYL